MESSNGEENVRELQLFSAGGLKLAIFADEIAAITEWKEPVPLPNAPPAILGVVSVQGRMLTVIDPPVLFKEAEKSSPGHLIALRGDEQLALAVGSLEGQLNISSENIRKPENGINALLGTVDQDNEQVYLIDVTKLFSSAIQGRERRRRHL